MTYGFKMAADVTDARATGMMKEVEDDLNRIIKVTLSISASQMKMVLNATLNLSNLFGQDYLPESLFLENMWLFRVEFFFITACNFLMVIHGQGFQ